MRRFDCNKFSNYTYNLIANFLIHLVMCSNFVGRVLKFNFGIFIYKDKNICKEMKEQINIVKNWKQFLNENIQNKKTIINLIFSENEISELYRIKDEIAFNYLKDLDIDPFSNEDESDLVSFIKNIFDRKGINVDDVDMKNILNLVNHNILI